MKFNSQICTSREQSERLLALGLKKETADMCWMYGEVLSCNPPELAVDIPAWSLGRLVEIIKKCDFKTIESEVWRKELKIFTLHLLIRSSDDLFENAISVIGALIHKGYFNKEYLV